LARGYLRQQGRNVAYLDLDPSGWATNSSRIAPRCTRSSRGHALAIEDPDQVESAMNSVIKAGADAVVDCPPLDPPQVVRALEVGDILVFPFKPGGNDLRAFARALSLHQAKAERAGAAGGARPQMFGWLTNSCGASSTTGFS